MIDRTAHFGYYHDRSMMLFKSADERGGTGQAFKEVGEADVPTTARRVGPTLSEVTNGS